MKIAAKRKAGEILERGGISSRIIALANDISQGTYKNAIEKAGQISVLVEAATFDDYWSEKAAIGKHREGAILNGLIEGCLHRDRCICFVNPHMPGSDE